MNRTGSLKNHLSRRGARHANSFYSVENGLVHPAEHKSRCRPPSCADVYLHSTDHTTVIDSVVGKPRPGNFCC